MNVFSCGYLPSSLVKCLFTSYSFQIGCFFFLLLSFASFFKKYILGTSPFFIFFIYLLYVFFGHVACGILVP